MYLKKKLDRDYQTADLFNAADLTLDIEKIDCKSGHFKTVIANHVLEHVDDKIALWEINRILKSGGILIASVPIIEGWDKSYENTQITSPKDRDLHFGQPDHCRFYGRDFRDRVVESGFFCREVTAFGSEVVRYSLIPGEKIFVCTKK